MLTIQFTDTEIKRLNDNYAKEQQAKQDIKTVRFICSLFSEQSEIEQIENGRMYVKAIGGVIK